METGPPVIYILKIFRLICLQTQGTLRYVFVLFPLGPSVPYMSLWLLRYPYVSSYLLIVFLECGLRLELEQKLEPE